MRKISRILIHPRSGDQFLVKDLLQDFHTQYGVIKAKDLKKDNLESNKKERFFSLEPYFPDLYQNLQRGPQIMIQKDVGLVLVKTGANKNFMVVDAGGGSGSLCLALANVCKQVTAYEINPENCGIITRNKHWFGANNLLLRQENIYDGIKETNLDLITLDLPEPWQVLAHAEKALKSGGFLVTYLPNLTQVQHFIEDAKKTRIHVIETIELLERRWKIEDRILRPEFNMLGHTGFMTFCRKF